jgi:hypothetical protein
MTAAGLSMRRPRPWTRSDLEGGVPGARRQAGSRRRAVGWIQNVRQQAEEPRRSDDGGDGGGDGGAAGNGRERGLSGFGRKEAAVEHRRTREKEEEGGAARSEASSRQAGEGREARGVAQAETPPRAC